MRTRGSNGPVKGETGGTNTSKNPKRPALADLSNNTTPSQKPRKENQADSAFFIEASPQTEQALNAAVEKALPNVYTASRMRITERSPGGGAIEAETTTSRKRPMSRERDFRVEETDSNGEIKVRRGLFFAERKKAKTAVPIPAHLAKKPLVEKSFSVSKITGKDVQNVPLRSELLKEKTVAGGSAFEGAQKVFGKNTAKIFHLCHLAAVCLAAGIIDTQVIENIFVGTNKSNWTKKHYELALRKILLNHPDLALKFLGEAKLLEGSNVAVSESLIFEFSDLRGRSYRGPVHIDSLSLETESVTASKVLGVVIETLVEMNNRIAEDDEDFSSAPRLR